MVSSLRLIRWFLQSWAHSFKTFLERASSVNLHLEVILFTQVILAPGRCKKAPSVVQRVKNSMTNLAKCLALLLMFFKHIWALLGLSPSKGIFCHYTNTTGEGIKNTHARNYPYHKVSLGNWLRFNHVWKPLSRKNENNEEKSHFGLCLKILSLWWCSWGV